jgi:hypothetical protein
MLIKIITVTIARLITKVIIKTIATLLTKTDINIRKSSRKVCYFSPILTKTGTVERFW